MHGLRWCPLVGLLVALMSAAATFGQAMESAEPFKVGTFDIDGIGTLRLPVVAGEEPSGEMGARLPPVKSYR